MAEDFPDTPADTLTAPPPAAAGTTDASTAGSPAATYRSTTSSAGTRATARGVPSRHPSNTTASTASSRSRAPPRWSSTPCFGASCTPTTTEAVGLHGSRDAQYPDRSPFSCARREACTCARSRRCRSAAGGRCAWSDPRSSLSTERSSRGVDRGRTSR